MNSKRTAVLAVLAVILGIGIIAFVVPIIQNHTMDDGPGPDTLPTPARGLAADNARLVLPTQAGQPAAIFMDLHNRSLDTLHITEVVLDHADDTIIADIATPDISRVSSLDIEAGETLRFAPETQLALLSDYDAEVVPGAELTLRITIDDGTQFEFPVSVESALGEDGKVKMP